MRALSKQPALLQLLEAGSPKQTLIRCCSIIEVLRSAQRTNWSDARVAIAHAASHDAGGDEPPTWAVRRTTFISFNLGRVTPKTLINCGPNFQTAVYIRWVLSRPYLQIAYAKNSRLHNPLPKKYY